MEPKLSPLTPLSRSQPVMRYAPSPTGALHLGNLKTAIEAWESCRRQGGLFILRIEDIDTPRTVAGSEAGMIDDLRWLGLDWDEGPDVGGPAGPYRQSERGDVYTDALETLRRQGLTYLCTCSRKDLREASAPHGPDGPAYPGFCRERDEAQQRAHPAGAAARLNLRRSSGKDSAGPESPGAPALIEFDDAAFGPQRFDLNRLCGDFVIRRRDGLWAYQLACAVDDALMGVTHVLRGADLLESTPRQIAILRALELPVPAYEHVSLLADRGGRRMSKRDGSDSLQELRAKGLTPDDVREQIAALPLVEPSAGDG